MVLPPTACDFSIARSAAAPSFVPAAVASSCVVRRGKLLMFALQPCPKAAMHSAGSSFRMAVTAAPGKSALTSRLVCGTVTGWAACSKSTNIVFCVFLQFLRFCFVLVYICLTCFTGFAFFFTFCCDISI